LDITHYLPFLERMLTPPRFQHSLGVMHVLEELAEIYPFDRERAMVAGLLHDAAKDMEPDQIVVLAQEAGVAIRHPCEWNPMYLHGPVGAFLIFRELDVTDPLILDLITRHTYYGREIDFDVPLHWCLRFADLLEPTRDWQGKNRLKQVVYAGQMAEGALLQTAWVREWFEENGTPVHPNMTSVCQQLSSQLGVDVSFFQRW
jgi:predicted HD superfamily hydrolase involved in NAD metabolism